MCVELCVRGITLLLATMLELRTELWLTAGVVVISVVSGMGVLQGREMGGREPRARARRPQALRLRTGVIM